jgi:hypothetical protein
MMFTDLKELRVRLETHFDIVCYNEGASDNDDDDKMPDPLGGALLSAIDLLKILEEGNWKTVHEALKAWEIRSDTGKPKPKVV